MPIYEYQCNDCGHQFDELQKIADAPLRDCPECDQAALIKLVSAPSFRLKGSGWYETDFKKDNRKNLAEDTPSPKSTSSGGESKSSDTKAKKESTSKSEPAAKPSKPSKSAGAAGS